MNVSPSFLLGLGVALLADELFEWLPGEATASGLALAALALPLPGLWARVTGRRVHGLAQRGARAGPLLLVALRLQPLTVPLAYLALVGAGGLTDFVAHNVPDSYLLRFALLLAPLVLLELSLRSVEQRTTSWLELRSLDAPVPIGPGFQGMTLLVIVCVLLFGALLDVVGLDRGLEVFFHATALGATFGLITMVLGLSVVLPLLFRHVLPTTPALPDRVAGEIWNAAARLGFSPRRVLALRTDDRVVNAALVGPLPWPRYLVLTDGIMLYLDRVALRGVVAHEVGHARAGHPALLLVVFAVIPLLLVQPLTRVDLEAAQPLILVGVGAVLALGGFFALRALMHRFEFEADQLSAVALGGAAPCIQALQRVGDLFPSQRERSSLRHPSEAERVRSLSAWDNDPAYRDAFLRRGRAVRLTILVSLAAALVVSFWSHARAASLDVATWRFHTGDFVGARAALAEADPAEEPERAASLKDQIDAAVGLLGAGGPWSAIHGELATRAWERALAIAATHDPRAARPYFALALADDDPVRTSAWMWAEAMADGHTAHAARIARHLEHLAGTPPELRSAIERDAPR